MKDDESKLVYSSEQGDLRKSKSSTLESEVNENEIELYIRRLTSGKGRTIIEVTGLPDNKSWNKKLAKDLKKSLGVGGAYKNDFIEIHGEKAQEVLDLLSSRRLKVKKIGG